MDISLIICTRNRVSEIAECLTQVAISRLTSPLLDLEVIVVDNGSTDDTPILLSQWGIRESGEYKIITCPEPGLSRARNAGLRNAIGRIIAYTDDDCRISDTYFSDLYEAFASDNQPVLRGGRVVLGNPNDLPLTITNLNTKTRWKKVNRAARFSNLGNCLLGCNMAFSRELIDVVGCFDQNLGAGSAIPGGEDVDYVFRAYERDVTIEFSPVIVVSHYHGRASKSEGYRLMKDYSIGSGALYAKYILVNPILCRQFIWDAKSAIFEIFKKKNTFMPSIGFSHIDKIIFSIEGFVIYVKLRLASLFIGTRIDDDITSS